LPAAPTIITASIQHFATVHSLPLIQGMQHLKHIGGNFAMHEKKKRFEKKSNKKSN